jgi:hypothetical protein
MNVSKLIYVVEGMLGYELSLTGLGPTTTIERPEHLFSTLDIESAFQKYDDVYDDWIEFGEGATIFALVPGTDEKLTVERHYDHDEVVSYWTNRWNDFHEVEESILLEEVGEV